MSTRRFLVSGCGGPLQSVLLYLSKILDLVKIKVKCFKVGLLFYDIVNDSIISVNCSIILFQFLCCLAVCMFIFKAN